MECPICHTAEPSDLPYRTVANDGGSTICTTCGTRYHKCRDSVFRAGFSPLNCPHCGYVEAEAEIGYLGSFAVDKSKLEPKYAKKNIPLNASS